jgi:putative sensory transduction regulator
MPGAASDAPVRPTDVERWLDDLGLVPSDRADRDGVTSWDLRLDGRRRFDVPITLILDPALALICWVHFAPPIGDAFRKSYRKLLRWNDEYPFVKFSLAEDERPVLATEIPVAVLDRDALGLAIARSLAIADQLLEESAGWLWIGGRIPDSSGRTSRGAALLDRYADRLGELAATTGVEAAI